MRKILAAVAVIAGTVACGLSIAWAASNTTGTNVSCATATASLPAHTVGVDGTDVHTISGTQATASQCHTETYTIPTSTETVTATPTQTSSSQSSSSTTSSQTTTSSTTTSGGSQTFNCFSSPGACGYPDPANGTVGVPPDTSLTPSGSLTVTTNGAVINALNVTGQITVQANNVTIKNTRVALSGAGSGFMNGNGPASADIVIGRGAGGAQVTGTQLINDTLTNAADGTTVQHAVYNGVPGGTTPADTVADGVYAYTTRDPNVSTVDTCSTGQQNVPGGGVDSLWWGPGTIKNSYEIANIYIACDHIENVYLFAGQSLDVEHSVLLNADNQTANVFDDGKGGAANVKINSSLLAGGGFDIYGDANQTTPSGSVTVTNNHFARCLTTMVNGSGGTHLCSGGADSHGYFPKGGSFGDAASIPSGATWTGNVWDDNGASVN